MLAPDTDRAPLETAIGRLGLGQGTAIGEAIFSSLEQLEAAVPDPEIPKAVVVLSDGETTVGRSDSEAAIAALEAGVPVYTISFGTRSGTIDFRGERIAVPVAPEPLRRIAETTGGQFFETASESDLSQILAEIGSEIAFETEEREVTDWFAAGGLALLAGLLLLSVAAGDLGVSSLSISALAAADVRGHGLYPGTRASGCARPRPRDRGRGHHRRRG